MSARFGSEGFGARVQDLLGPLGRAPRRRGEPAEVDVRTGRTVPAVTVRAALAVAGVAAVVVAATAPGRVVPVSLLGLMVLVGAAPAVAPRLPLTALLLLVVGVRLLVADPAPPLVLAALVLLVHVVLRLAPVAARTGWRTDVEVAVLRDDLPAALAAQAGAQVLALVAGLASAADAGTGWHVVGLVVVLGLATLAIAPPARPWWRAAP
ncbi:hypothetical protein [Cellulomonas wangsupingiae]|uniref:MFS transporter n=1 Tax=Cellulomonas wangsupingiae TaxID=2968085 RepID=A0ABY5K4G3_9CELL|nr:hypothetical protein [Cellulomonas wangsupingiae]MCC2333683.1 hypothetical protein [Cellulomonas wangsupingiae]UUI64948.1 hypothetical protein NP075_17840 [Cellulomonas wangsupingiae]